MKITIVLVGLAIHNDDFPYLYVEKKQGLGKPERTQDTDISMDHLFTSKTSPDLAKDKPCYFV